MNIKSRFTRVLLDIAFKLPLFFPKYIRYLANKYHSNSDYINEIKSSEPKYKEVSLFESDFYWKAISFTIIVNNDELDSIKKWKKKASLNMHSEYESKMLESGGFDRGTGWVNLGVIRIDNETFMDDLNSIYMNSIYLDSVFISLVKYSSGLFAVTLYIYLSDEATGSVKSVIPPRMTDFIRLNSFNIFSRKQFGSHLLMEDNHCESYLMERKQKVYDEAWKFFDILKKEIGIKRNNDEVYCVSDVYLDQDFPYFERNSGSDRHEKFILLPKMRHFSDVKLSSNKDESFVADKYFNINGIDLTYMKIRPHSTFDKYDDFKKKYCSNVESHLAIAPLLLIVKLIDKISGDINNLRLYNKKASMAKLHRSLFAIVHQLHLIDGWLKALKKELPHYLLAGYLEPSNAIIATQINRVAELQRVVKTFYSLSENRIQVSNVKYNQIYSVVVFVFVFIQVVLAAMTIDWGKSNVWYSPIVTWLVAIFKT